MLIIRLQRAGKKKQAFFRLVLQEQSWKPQGKAVELLGFYNPHTKEKKFQEERITYWISKGAQLSPTVHNLFVETKIIAGPKIKAWRPKKKKAKEAEPAPSAEPKEAAGPEKSEPRPEGREAKDEAKSKEKPGAAQEETKEQAPKDESAKEPITEKEETKPKKEKPEEETPTLPEEVQSPEQSVEPKQ